MNTPDNNNSTPRPTNNAPSLLDSGEVGSSLPNEAAIEKRLAKKSLVDLMYDGFYLIFLLKNGYHADNAEMFRSRVSVFLNKFETIARKQSYAAEDIYQAKYAYCALLDETIMSSQHPGFDALKRDWEMNPLQLSMFGSQLAGEKFYENLEELRAQGAERLPSLDVYYYALLLGFQGKYRLEASEKIKYLIARLGDEIQHLKGRKREFAPFWAIPDQIRNVIRTHIPVWVVFPLALVMAGIGYGGYRYFLSDYTLTTLDAHQNIIDANQEQANITIFLP